MSMGIEQEVRSGGVQDACERTQACRWHDTYSCQCFSSYSTEQVGKFLKKIIRKSRKSCIKQAGYTTQDSIRNMNVNRVASIHEKTQQVTFNKTFNEISLQAFSCGYTNNDCPLSISRRGGSDTLFMPPQISLSKRVSVWIYKSDYLNSGDCNSCPACWKQSSLVSL